MTVSPTNAKEKEKDTIYSVDEEYGSITEKNDLEAQQPSTDCDLTCNSSLAKDLLRMLACGVAGIIFGWCMEKSRGRLASSLHGVCVGTENTNRFTPLAARSYFWNAICAWKRRGAKLLGEDEFLTFVLSSFWARDNQITNGVWEMDNAQNVHCCNGIR